MRGYANPWAVAGLGLLLLLLAIGAWAIVAGGAAGLPTPWQVGSRAWRMLQSTTPGDSGALLPLAETLARTGLGWLLAGLVAIPLGVAVGLSPLLHGALSPFLQLLRPISPLAWVPLALFATGDGTVGALAAIVAGAAWPMLLHAATGVAGVRREWLNVARTLECGPVRTTWRVVLPAAAPVMMRGARLAMLVAWLVAVAVGMLPGGTGLGRHIWQSWTLPAPADLLALLLLTGLAGMALDRLLALAEAASAYRD